MRVDQVIALCAVASREQFSALTKSTLTGLLWGCK
jgi:hypothetical protein